jgi:RNase P subunit RPR2
MPDNNVLNSIHTLNFKNALSSNGFNTHERQRFEYCPNCLVVFIPGVNLKMRCVFTKRSKKHNSSSSRTGSGNTAEDPWRPRNRILRQTCLSCNKHADYELIKPQRASKVETATVTAVGGFVAEWKPSSISEPSVKKKTDTQVAKERAKKRKKSNLLNLLSERKQQEEEAKKKSSILSFEEFMKH